MTNLTQPLIILTPDQQRKRDTSLFKLGYKAGAAKTAKDMLNKKPAEQMVHKKNIKKIDPDPKMIDDMLDYFDKKYNK